MAKLRQLPQLYLRGRLRKTMTNLTAAERAEVDKLATDIANADYMGGCKREFMRKLSRTIAADYFTDADAAHTEYLIAVWRAVVYLLHSSHYAFACGKCGASTYQTMRGREQKIAHANYIWCPACRHTLLTDRGSLTRRVKYIDYDKLQSFIATHANDRGFVTPTCVTPIVETKLDSKVPNRDEIINNQDKLKSFIGQFVMNYFRQQIRENRIIRHGPDRMRRCGEASKMFALGLRDTLQRHQVRHRHYVDADATIFYTNLNALSPEISEYLRWMMNYINTLGVHTETLTDRIVIHHQPPSTHQLTIEVSGKRIVDFAAATNGNDGEIDAIDMVPSTYDGVVDHADASAESDMVCELRREATPLMRKIIDAIMAESQPTIDLNVIGQLVGCDVTTVSNQLAELRQIYECLEEAS